MSKLTWSSIVRLGLIQMAIGSVVVLTTSTLNRLMVVELSLSAVLPAALVALHYGIQITRPHWGFLSDTRGNRTFWIISGMAVLGLGGFGAALAVVVIENSYLGGLAVGVLSYSLIGLGVGACGTSLLSLLATGVASRRRAAAATITWLMMIAGIALTAGGVGAALDPYSANRLLVIVALVATVSLVLTALAIRGIEARTAFEPREIDHGGFVDGLREVWAEPQARLFTVFVFLSMTAYFMQELILEPYAGLVFGFTPGESTMLSGAQNGGVFLGMVAVGVLASGFGLGNLRHWVVGGCLASAVALLCIAGAGLAGPSAPLTAATVFLGIGNGAFAVAAIGSMMKLAGEGRSRREGTRVGLWGAAQAVAAGFGGLVGAGLVDLMRAELADDAKAFATVFCIEALLFGASAVMAWRIMDRAPSPSLSAHAVPGE